MNDFQRDDEWQRGVRDAILAPEFYKEKANEGRYVFLDKGKISVELQRLFAVDTIVQGKDGNAISIEEKIVRWKGKRYDSLCIETDSCTVPGHESPGWIKYGKCDYLLYCFQLEDESLECWLINFDKLKNYYEKNNDRLRKFRMEYTINKTIGVLAPLEEIKELEPKIYTLYKIPF